MSFAAPKGNGSLSSRAKGKKRPRGSNLKAMASVSTGMQETPAHVERHLRSVLSSIRKSSPLNFSVEVSDADAETSTVTNLRTLQNHLGELQNVRRNLALKQQRIEELEGNQEAIKATQLALKREQRQRAELDRANSEEIRSLRTTNRELKQRLLQATDAETSVREDLRQAEKGGSRWFCITLV